MLAHFVCGKKGKRKMGVNGKEIERERNNTGKMEGNWEKYVNEMYRTYNCENICIRGK
jgi:hypothetical protein